MSPFPYRCNKPNLVNVDLTDSKKLKMFASLYDWLRIKDENKLICPNELKKASQHLGYSKTESHKM